MFAVQQVVHDLLLEADFATFSFLDEASSLLESIDFLNVGCLGDLLLQESLLESRRLLVVNLH